MPETVVWGQGQDKVFVDYLTDAMHRALNERRPLEAKWKDYLEQYRAPLTDSTKRFPYEGAADYTMQFAATIVDPLIARFVTTLHAPANLWSLQPLNERWVDLAKPFQDYLEYLDKTRLKMFDVDYRAAIELVKLGTCVYKHGWAYESRRVNTYDPATGQVVPTRQTISGPFVDHVSLLDFLIPSESYEIQPDMQGGAPWVAEQFSLTRPAFKAKAIGQEPFLPEYDPAAVAIVEKFEDSNRDAAATVKDAKYALDNNVPSDFKRINLWEVHCRFDSTGDGSVDDVVATFHLPSRTLLRAIYNPYAHNQRPYAAARYMRGDGFYGIGVIEQAEMVQEILSELLNSSMDNARLANSPMIAVKPGANVVPGEPIYPLKMWLLDNPATDVREFKFTTPYPSLQQLGPLIQLFGERRTGFSDLQQGNIQGLPSRTPATSMMQLLQEGNRRFDLTLKDLRFCLDEVGTRILQNCQQFMSNPVQNPEAGRQLEMVVMALGQPEGGYVAQTLALPLDDVANGLGVNVTATSGSVNKEVEKQSFLGLLQLQKDLFVPTYMTLAQVLSNPQVQLAMPAVFQTASQLFVGTAELQTRLYEQFDIRNPEESVVNAAVILDAASRLNPLALAASVSAGAFGGTGGESAETGGGAGVSGVSGGD